jgi:hypothetical protein
MELRTPQKHKIATFSKSVATMTMKGTPVKGSFIQEYCCIRNYVTLRTY